VDGINGFLAAALDGGVPDLQKEKKQVHAWPGVLLS
jgi:hypothetical protein